VHTTTPTTLSHPSRRSSDLVRASQRSDHAGSEHRSAAERHSQPGLASSRPASKNGEIFVLEVNPRASRTVPFVAKTVGRPIAKIAAHIMAGETLDEAFAHYGSKPNLNELNHVAVKEAVFPFARFPGVDTLLGPEMKSTGEVMGLDTDFALAFAKGQLGAGV